MRKICFIVIGIIAGGFGFFGSVLQAFAQEATGIRMQPAIIEENIDPGKTFSGAVRATNISDSSRAFYVLARDVSGVDDEGKPLFGGPSEQTGYEISSWIAIPQEPFTIAPGATKEIPFSVVVPKNANPGSHYGAIFVGTTPPKPTESGTGVGYQVGTIVSFKVSGEIVEQASIREFRTERWIYGKTPVKFLTRIENAGNVLARPRGPIEITNLFGKKIATARMNDDAAAVLPHTIRQFSADWNTDAFAFGRYEAAMSLVYGEEQGKKTITNILSFWILPWKIIAGIFGALILLALILKLSVERSIQRRIREAGGDPAYRRRAQRESAPISRLLFMTIAALLASLLFVIALFFFFA